ncbi:MAG TPA: NAD(P)H-dependent oxidoreductase [Hyphomicrobiaceae bacterium]|nr:NAD(P)H-dependent oxidoreductase [Hyphomicrobiaceae bacterium]
MDASAKRPFTLLGLSGSIRRGSNCTAVLRTLKESLAAGVEMTIFGLEQVPLYNEDDDTETPPAPVARLRRAIAEADGLVIVSPEYNHGMSGVIKNALDWSSRPTSNSPLVNKPVVIMTSASSILGGVRAQAQLNETLHGTFSRVVPGRQVVIGNARHKIKDGRLVDEATRLFALEAIERLLDEICLVQRRPPRSSLEEAARRITAKGPR